MSQSINVTNSLLDAAANTDAEHKYLSFLCESQLYAVSILHVVQIVGIQTITPIPESPDYAKGVINIRGNIISVIDTRCRLKRPEQIYNEKTCIIIATVGEIEVGFIVDEVDEVQEIDPAAIMMPAKTSADYTNTYVTGIATMQNRVILILDVEKLFTFSELEKLGQRAQLHA